MQTITTIGLDIAKSIFQIHGIDAAGDVIVRRKLKRLAAFAPVKQYSARKMEVDMLRILLATIIFTLREYPD